jgi:hypothetical protein
MKKLELHQMIREEYRRTLSEAADPKISLALNEFEDALVSIERSVRNHPRRTQILDTVDKIEDLFDLLKKLTQRSRMKKSELRQMIREEIRRLTEAKVDGKRRQQVAQELSQMQRVGLVKATTDAVERTMNGEFDEVISQSMTTREAADSIADLVNDQDRRGGIIRRAGSTIPFTF